MKKYEIYPKVQELMYFDNEIEFDSIEVEFDEYVDEVTRDFANEIAKDYTGDKVLKLEIYANEKFIKGYQINIYNKNIIIKAIDSDMAYYALVTLKQILEQSENKISSLRIYDYPSMDIRGVIEGYYGIPFDFQRRYETMIFGAKFKNNVFIYAPKDDPYHREKWYELYPDEKLEDIRKLAKLGKSIKNNFVWTIAPFYKHMIDLDNFDVYMEVIIEKMNQIYDTGVRQFGVLGDDVGLLDPQIPIKIMKELSYWRKMKKDVKDLIYCPGAYHLENGTWNYPEINAYEKEFPNDVHLFHTGRNVIAPVKKEDLEDYKFLNSYEENGKIHERKNPVFWLNFPVNDIDDNFRKLHMGSLSFLDTRVDSLKGLVTNTMQETYASFLAIFGISDYAWNTKGFDYKDSYEHALKLLEPNAHEQIKKIFEHMTNQDEKGIKNLIESYDISEYLVKDNFLYSDLKYIKNYFEGLIDTINEYFEKAENKNLKNDIMPYTLNLLEKSEAIIYLIEAYFEKDKKEAIKYFESAEGKLFEANNHIIYVNPERNKILQADSATKYINPFIEKFKDIVFDKVNYTKISKPELLYYPEMDGSKKYRIPVLFKTAEDTLLAIADRRNYIVEDWGDIDTVVRRKKKNSTFGPQRKIIDLQSNNSLKKYAFTIDSGILQSKITGRIFLFNTMFPNSKGFLESERGSGYVCVNDKKYLELFDKNNQRLYLDKNIVRTMDGKKTSYKIVRVDGQPFSRYGDVYVGDMNVGNIFTGEGPLRVKKTSFLTMTYSDDDGKTWHGFKMLNKYLKEDYMKFLGVSPSKGYELEDGRLVFPAYFTNQFDKQTSCLIISDDMGESWYIGAIFNDKRAEKSQVIDFNSDFDETYQTGESSLILHKDNVLRLIARNYYGGLPKNHLTAISEDGGLSFENEVDLLDYETQSWCQMGSISFEKNQNEYVIVSAPSTSNSYRRANGVLNLLKYDTTSKKLELIDSKNIDSGYFGYSTLEKIGENRFAIFYERSKDAMGNNIELVYREFELSIFDRL